MAGRGEAAGVRDPRSSPATTERELLVVSAVLIAGSEKAAAHRLGLSHSTVKHHLANAQSKVGATTTAAQSRNGTQLLATMRAREATVPITREETRRMRRRVRGVEWEAVEVTPPG